MKFIDLFFFGRNLSAVEQQNLRGEIFVKEFASIAENRMTLWKTGGSFSQTGTRFLLGVCPSWNSYDLYLLDCINDSLKKKLIEEVLEVLDLDYANCLEDIQNIFGKIKHPHPILGIWEEGVLSTSLWGWDAKNFFMEKFDFVWQPPKTWLNQR